MRMTLSAPKRVRNDRVELTWVSLFAAGTHIRENHRDTCFSRRRFRTPDLLIETRIAAVQVINALVLGDPVSRSAKIEARVRDPVGVSPDDRPEVRSDPRLVHSRRVDRIRATTLAFRPVRSGARTEVMMPP